MSATHQFCIMRISKLHTNANVGGALSHHLRTRQTDNADPERMGKNWFYPNFSADKSEQKDIEYRRKLQRKAIAMYKSRLPQKVRKNGVRAVEFMMTVSPEVMQRKDFNSVKYLNDCGNWVREKFGKENVFFIAHHLDETTPHVSILITPIDENGKLNARKFFGGREKLSELQTDFHEKVGIKYGLERGQKGSKAKHQKIKTYYEKLNETEKQIDSTLADLEFRLPDKSLWQSGEEYKANVLYAVRNELSSLKPLINKGLAKDNVEKQLEQAKNENQKIIENQKKEINEILFERPNSVKIGDTVVNCRNGVGRAVVEKQEELEDVQKQLQQAKEQLKKLKNMSPEQFKKEYEKRQQNSQGWSYSR